MDLALAHHVAAGARRRRARSSTPARWLQLTYACRDAKEKLLADPKLASAPVTVLGRGSTVIGGTIKGELPRAEVEKVLVDGFFPECPRDAEPAPAARRRACRSSACPTPPTRRSRGTWRSSCTGRPRRWRTASAGGKKKKAADRRCRRRCCSTAASSRPTRCANRLLGRARRVGEGREGRPGARAGRRRPRPRGRARRGVLRAGAARQGRAHPRRHGPGVLHRRRDRAAGGARASRRR